MDRIKNIILGLRGLVRVRTVEPGDPALSVRLLASNLLFFGCFVRLTDQAQGTQLVLGHDRSSVVGHATAGTRGAGGSTGRSGFVKVASDAFRAAQPATFRLAGQRRCAASAAHARRHDTSAKETLAGPGAHDRGAHWTSGVSSSIHLTNDCGG